MATLPNENSRSKLYKESSVRLIDFKSRPSDAAITLDRTRESIDTNVNRSDENNNNGRYTNKNLAQKSKCICQCKLFLVEQFSKRLD
jgi:hypothetical protein